MINYGLDDCVGCERMERALDRELDEVERLRRVEADAERQIHELQRRLDNAEQVAAEYIDQLVDVHKRITIILAYNKVMDRLRQTRQETVEQQTWTP